MAGEDADREVGQGLEAGLGHALVRLGANELTHVRQQLVQDRVHRGRRQSGDRLDVRDAPKLKRHCLLPESKFSIW